jgi:hypothetical protein
VQLIWRVAARLVHVAAVPALTDVWFRARAVCQVAHESTTDSASAARQKSKLYSKLTENKETALKPTLKRLCEESLAMLKVQQAVLVVRCDSCSCARSVLSLALAKSILSCSSSLTPLYPLSTGRSVQKR